MWPVAVSWSWSQLVSSAQYTSYTMTKNFPLRPSPCVCGAGCRVSTHYTLHTIHITQRVLVWQLTFVPMFPVTGPVAADILHPVTRQPGECHL